MGVRRIERARRDELGEGPLWDAARGELLWVDIVGRAVHRLTLADGTIRTLEVAEPIGWVVPRRDHATYVAGFRSGFHLLDLATGARTPLGAPEADRPHNRLNDAKVDPAGRIWAGSKDDRDVEASGALYRLDPDHRWVRADDGYGVANGPTFSPDGGILYHTDSAARTIYAFDLARDGTLSGKRVWRVFDAAWGYPDGMTTDVEGCVWVAHWDGARISRFAPDATLVQSIPLPARNITSCAFAGAALDRLFVTSAAQGCGDDPDAGALFEVDTGVRGLPATPFAD